jgi:hypothetical protein
MGAGTNLRVKGIDGRKTILQVINTVKVGLILV